VYPRLKALSREVAFRGLRAPSPSVRWPKGRRDENTQPACPVSGDFAAGGSAGLRSKIFDLRLRQDYSFSHRASPIRNFDAMSEESAIPHSQVTELVIRWRDGDLTALEQLVPLVYDELRKLARSHLRRESPDQNLQSASLVHEAYLRLSGKKPPNLQNRAHFFGVAAHLMREILVDRARKTRASKRGAGVRDVSLDEAIGMPHQKNVDLIRLDDALQQLAKLDDRQCLIV